MNNRISINELIKNTDLYCSENHYCFYDWFCSDKALQLRFKRFIPKIKWLVKNKIIDGDNNYIWFKNNCPLYGKLYDDMRISRIKDNYFLGGFSPCSGHENVKNKCTVWILKEGYEIFEFKDWKTFKNEIIKNKKLKQKLTENFKNSKD